MQTVAKNKAEKWALGLVLGIYGSLLIAVMIFHEPWFDEAQSWLIARDASVHDMLFHIPHYEGHPPLWWLLLAVPAKLGVPYELGLKTVQAVFAVFGVYLLLFKSPFPIWVKCMLPFSYFLFYQYGVIARPYSMLFCAMCLCAMTWEGRNRKPFSFILSLMFLCLTSAYGILIAGGIASVWSIEILKARALFKDKRRLLALELLLVLALVLLWMLLPRDDTFANQLVFSGKANSVLQCALLFAFCLPAEATVTSYSGEEQLQLFFPDIPEIAIMTLISTVIWGLLFYISRRKKTFWYLIVPYVLLLVFGSVKYFNFHHLGILFHLFLFSAWISTDKDIQILRLSKLSVLQVILSVFLILGIAINISWSSFCSVTDIKHSYAAGRELSDFIKNNHLEQYNWASIWRVDRDDDNEIAYEDTHSLPQVVYEANPYFDIPLTGIQAGGRSYVDHVVLTKDQTDEELDMLKSRGTDIIIQAEYDKYCVETLVADTQMKVIAQIPYDRPWKNTLTYQDIFITMRADLAQQVLPELFTGK